MESVLLALRKAYNCKIAHWRIFSDGKLPTLFYYITQFELRPRVNKDRYQGKIALNLTFSHRLFYNCISCSIGRA